MSLFRERGYDAVKLEEIAEHAEVSPGTIYTYFKTKNDLLLEIVVDDLKLAIQEVDVLLQGPFGSAHEMLDRIIDCHCDGIEDRVSRDMWRVAVADYIRNPRSVFGTEYENSLTTIDRQFVMFFQRLMRENKLPRTHSARLLAAGLSNQFNMSFIEFIRSETMSLDAMATRLKRLSRLSLIPMSEQRPDPME
ncbi:TetR/AcrR family transcriptional regulator [Ruegeria sp.]|uniref:TetR/AcrR family transcriptional regulator n=1 Tax=Ruegeria sp. TaxID=1879320 RepID=UPI00231FEAED|nr:TetR/AcrR family transcriptional regulator [Ruegeria sp.]MDA7966507.1 TetR/AcrR family transcriptional regulator [Ruegeria sp.]